MPVKDQNGHAFSTSETAYHATEHDIWQIPDFFVGSTWFKSRTDCKLSQQGRWISLEIWCHNICLPKCYPGICLERMRGSLKI